MGKETYHALNSARTTDEELDSVVDKVVSGLFSVVVTMGKRSGQSYSSQLISSQVQYQSLDAQKEAQQR